MGGHDFETIFDTIDFPKKGYITTEQIHQFCETLYYAPLCIKHVEGAVKLKAGPSGMVTKQEFLNVFTEIENRRATEEHAFWNFQALDYTGCNRISLRDTLLLFREIHGELFSLSTWRRFLDSREMPDNDVCFDEVRYWLCSPPSGSACSAKEFKQEENRVTMKQQDYLHDNYSYMRHGLDDEYSRQKERDDHEDEVNRNVRRKLHKWNKLGLEAMLFDDGLDVDDTEVKVKSRGQITMSQITELLQMKYDKLREKLMLQMAKHASATEDEQTEFLQQLRRQVKKLLKQGEDYRGSIPAGGLQLMASLAGLMGELRKDDWMHRRDIEVLKNKLRQEGRTVAEINEVVQEEYENVIAGDSTCAGLLLQLHKRFYQERETLLATLQMAANQPLSQSMSVEYGRLMHQLLIMEEEKAFPQVATAVGLAERAMDPRSDRSDWDRSRSERLAQLRLHERRGEKRQKPPRTMPDESIETAGIIEVQIEIVREMTKKHFYEREAMIYMLQGKESASIQRQARKMKRDARKQQLKSLQNQHKNWKATPKADKSAAHNILLEATWLRMEERRSELEQMYPNISGEEMAEVIMADLQQKQGLDFEVILQSLQNQSQPELITTLKHQFKCRLDELYDNIVHVVLGALDVSSEDEEYVQALEQKYESLRRRIFYMAIKEQYATDWSRFSQEEKQIAMKEIIRKEKLLRSEGRHQDMEQLIGPKGKLMPSLQSLMGVDKMEYQRLKTQQLEDEEEEQKSVNILADLVPRFESEQDAMLSWLQTPEAKGQILRNRRMKIVEMRIEACRADNEDDFEIAALSAGLMERVDDALTKRNPSDVRRQTWLSKKRVQLRRRRIVQEEAYRNSRILDKADIPKKGDITGLQVVYIQEMLKRHQDEREVILSHLQDESLDELTEAASVLDEMEQNKRLAELQGKWHGLNMAREDDREENVGILEEAAAIRAVGTMKVLGTRGQAADIEAVTVCLLGELQEEQDRELARCLRDIHTMDDNSMRSALEGELVRRVEERAVNVLIVLTHYQGDVQDEHLLKALKEKYHVLREKLLVDSLVGRVGSDQWQALSEKEKQVKMTSLDAQAREQEKAGKLLSSLLGDGFYLKERIPAIMGVCHHVFRNQVKGQQMAGNAVNLHLEEYSEPSKKTDARPNPIEALLKRHEVDKTALLRQLDGQLDDSFSEHERLVQLIRYRRERKQVAQQQTFVLAGTLAGLLERQEPEVKYRLVRDKERYLQMAKEELRSILRKEPRPSTEEVVTSRDMSVLLESVMDLLDGKHLQERELFVKILGRAEKFEGAQQMATLSTQQQRVDKTKELKEARWRTITDERLEDLESLTEAMVYRKETCRAEVAALTTEVGVDEEEIVRALMADLLEYQNSEAERLLLGLVEKHFDEVSKYQHQILVDKKMNLAENIALVVFSLERRDGANEVDVIEALKGKYDALKDKLLAEALMKEFGASQWNRMSETERQKKIFQLKLTERQLRKEGRKDEANALIAFGLNIGELLKDQEHLKRLMGETAEEQRRRAAEKLKLRQQRLEEGYSENDCDILDQQDAELITEREKHRKRNILHDLEERFDQEKRDLIDQLRSGDESERLANLARLRRDERLARNERDFMAAALVLGLSEAKGGPINRDEERRRQETLALARLQAARLRQEGATADDNIVVDLQDRASLQEAIAVDLDRRQRQERDFLIKLLEDKLSGPHRKAAAAMSPEEREDKMFELAELRKHWLVSDDRSAHDLKEIFKEAAGCALEITKAQFEVYGKPSADSNLQVALHANLQEQQKIQAKRFLEEIKNQNLKTLQNHYKALSMLNTDNTYDNIATVLLSSKDLQQEDEEYSGELTNATVIRALEQKYDAIKDKILMQALMREHSQEEWAGMSDQEKQRKLIDLKLKERQLRKEGRINEIADIIGKQLENEESLDNLLPSSTVSKKKELRSMQAKRRILVAERTEQGLPTDDETIDNIIQEQIKQKRRNILDDLERNLDVEKLALLRTLQQHRDQLAADRERQVQMAKLRHDQRRLQRDDKLTTVALLIQTAKMDDKKRQAGIVSELDRQRALARDRLAARRLRRDDYTALDQDDLERKLCQDEETAKLEDAVKDAEGRTILEALMTTVEGRQEEEMDILMALLDTAQSQTHLTTAAHLRADEELKSELLRLEQEQIRATNKSKNTVLFLNEEMMTAVQGKQHMSTVAQYRSDHLKLIGDALVYRLEVERRLLSTKQPDLLGEDLEEELLVSLVTDLQEKQVAEMNAIQKLMDDLDEDMMREVNKSQQVARREGWFDNLTWSVFRLSQDDPAYIDEKRTIEEKMTSLLKKLEAKYTREREEFIEDAKKNAPDGETLNRAALKRLEELQEEYDKNKRDIITEMQPERDLLLHKLESRHLMKRTKDYEDMALRNNIKLVQEHHEKTEEQSVQEPGKQTTLLQQRMAQRRDARREAKSQKLSRESTLDSFDDVKKPAGPKQPSPFESMHREKSVLDVDVSEEQKQAMFSQLVRQQKNLQSKITEQQIRQEQMLQRRLAARQGKQQEEAAELLSLSQRQKSTLERTQQDEKERQLTKMQAKVSKMKEQREPPPSVAKAKVHRK